MAESKLASPIKILKDVFSMLSLGCILISDLVATNLFMHSLPSMILVYLAASFLHQMFLHEIKFYWQIGSVIYLP